MFVAPLIDFPPFRVPASLWLPLAALAGVALDRLLGEARRWHPLVGFGRLANVIERLLNRGPQGWRRLGGIIAWALVVLPWVALALFAKRGNLASWLIERFDDADVRFR